MEKNFSYMTLWDRPTAQPANCRKMDVMRVIYEYLRVSTVRFRGVFSMIVVVNECLRA